MTLEDRAGSRAETQLRAATTLPETLAVRGGLSTRCPAEHCRWAPTAQTRLSSRGVESTSEPTDGSAGKAPGLNTGTP